MHNKNVFYYVKRCEEAIQNDNMFSLVQNTQQKHCVNLKKRCVISSKYKLIFLKLIKLIMI